MKADSSLLNIVPRLFDALRHELHQYGDMLALLVRVQQRARQKHLLLSRSVELMQRFMYALIPASQPTAYNGAGSVDAGLPQTQSLYEAVG